MLCIALYLYSTRVFVYSVTISGWVLVCDLLDLSPYLYLCPILDSISDSALSLSPFHLFLILVDVDLTISWTYI